MTQPSYASRASQPEDSPSESRCYLRPHSRYDAVAKHPTARASLAEGGLNCGVLTLPADRGLTSSTSSSRKAAVPFLEHTSYFHFNFFFFLFLSTNNFDSEGFNRFKVRDVLLYLTCWAHVSANDPGPIWMKKSVAKAKLFFQNSSRFSLVFRTRARIFSKMRKNAATVTSRNFSIPIRFPS